MRLGGIYGSFRLTSVYQDEHKSPIREIGVERDRPLDFGHSGFALSLET